MEVLNRLFAEGGCLAVSPNCLERSLVLYRLLSEAHAEPSLVLGVSRRQDRVVGHAWVEVAGEPFRDKEARAFQPVVVFGQGGCARSATPLEPAMS